MPFYLISMLDPKNKVILKLNKIFSNSLLVDFLRSQYCANTHPTSVQSTLSSHIFRRMLRVRELVGITSMYSQSAIGRTTKKSFSGGKKKRKKVYFHDHEEKAHRGFGSTLLR